MRLQGGTSGILAALDAGRLDPLDASLPEERELRGLSAADRRQIDRRAKRRERKLARFVPF